MENMLLFGEKIRKKTALNKLRVASKENPMSSLWLDYNSEEMQRILDKLRG